MLNLKKKQSFLVLSGRIVHGRGIGKKAGMPTANLEITKDTIIPELGVYASKVKFGGSEYTGVTNVGLRPTVDSDEDITIETYILDFDGDIYEETIELELFILLRGQQKFEDMTMLRKQLRKDCAEAKKYFGA